MAKGEKAKPRVVLTKEVAGAVLEVGSSDEEKGKPEVTLSLPAGVLRLAALTLDEARGLGALLYRPVLIRIEVIYDEDAPARVEKAGKEAKGP